MGGNGSNKNELTTAAGVWVAAAVGMASGFGLYILALATTVLSIAVFSLFWHVEAWVRGRFGTEGE
jgi:putative Mg2+ transporter-C (MgtC) family protein